MNEIVKSVLATRFQVADAIHITTRLLQPLTLPPQVVVQALLATADREDAPDTHLQASAYETMNEVVRSSTDDTVQVVVQLIPVIMGKLGATLGMQILSADDKERQSELQALLCGVLQVRFYDT